ncbi:MAG: NAD(P)H-dependent oxidoreductase subunit E, partial [Candidatus Acidiferrales bacterium]
MSVKLSPELHRRLQELKKRYPVLRSALIPSLLFAQDELGYISDDLIDHLASELKLRRVQVEETISYYSMLRRRPAGKNHVQVCTNVACQLRGGYDVLDHVKKRCGVPAKTPTADGVFSWEEVECIGACTGAPAVQVNYDFYENLTAPQMSKLMDELKAGRRPSPVPYITGVQKEPHEAEVRVISRRFGLPNSPSIDTYLAHEGYQALRKALGQMAPEQIIDEVKRSNLRGRGGAGFPAGMKWSFVPKDSAKPKYIIANADESEPGTCKDRPLMELDPHQLIEGMVIAGRAVGSHQGYIYIRGEYRYVMEIVDRAIAEAYERGYLGKDILGSGFAFNLCTHTGAG